MTVAQNASHAEELVRGILSGMGYDPAPQVKAEPFDGGWLVHLILPDGKPVRGSLTFTVDGVDGSIRSFPSFVPPTRIQEEYSSLKATRPALG